MCKQIDPIFWELSYSVSNLNQVTAKNINKTNQKFSPPLGKKGVMTKWGKNSIAVTEGSAPCTKQGKETFFIV